MRRLLVATTNPGKLDEFRRLLSGLPAEVVGPRQLGLDLQVAEPHDTYEENARAKAEAWCRAAGELTLADDSGLEVAALGGGPGVRTGRHGGPDVADRVGYLLAQLNGAAAQDRSARMVCVLALAVPNGRPRVETFRGEVHGSVAHAPRGSGGFGFDPVFLLPSGVTTAELADSDKDRISHRGRAVRAALPRLHELLVGAGEPGGDRA